MSEVQIKAVFMAPDGKLFDTKAEVQDYLRRPKVVAALNVVTKGNEQLSDWLYEKQEFLEDVFSTGTIQRVTKSERKQLEKAFEALKNLENPPKALAFLIENAGAIQETFRWPTVKRLSDEERDQVIMASLLASTENDKELTDWIIASKLAIFEAFEAGKEKRVVSEKAAAGLEAYRQKKAAEKAAAEAEKATAAQ